MKARPAEKFEARWKVASFPSQSHPGLTHDVWRGADGVLYCTCLGWRYQIDPPAARRDCVHVKEARARLAAPASGTRIRQLSFADYLDRKDRDE